MKFNHAGYWVFLMASRAFSNALGSAGALGGMGRGAFHARNCLWGILASFRGVWE